MSGDAVGDLFDPEIMRFDIRLHRVDARRVEAIGGSAEERRDGFVFGDTLEIWGAVADEQALGKGAIRLKRGLRTED